MEPVTGQNPQAESPTETTVAPITRPRPDRSIGTEAPPAIRLEVLGGPMDGIAARKDADTITIGRDPGCDFVLPLDPMVSSHHARILRDAGAFWLEDLASRNGSYVGDHRVDGRVAITPGTLIVL